MAKMDKNTPDAPASADVPPAETKSTASPKRNRTRWGRVAIIAGVIGGAIWFGAPWLMARFTQVHINDARIAASVVTVSSEVAGRVTSLPVVVGDTVAADDVIAMIDRTSSEPQLAAVLSQLTAIDAQVTEIETRKKMIEKQLAAQREAALAGIAVAEANHEAALAALTNARSRYERVNTLAGQSIVSEQSLDEARAAFDSAAQQERAAFAAIGSARASLTIVEADAAQLDMLDSQIASVLAGRTGTEAERSLKETDLVHRTLTAEFDGIVDATFVDVGEYVTPGTRLLMYHAPARTWIDANVKETEFGKIRVGSKARITVDAIPDRTFDGEVIAVGGAATSQLALLPSPNPSGNFTKVTQRLPIRLSIDADGVELRPGMMVEVYIDVAD